MTYYIIKSGVYDQGLFWIGSELLKGVKKAIELSKADEDDYHDWNLYEYKNDENVFIGHANKSVDHFIKGNE
jgi:hypothetical protein